MSWVLHKMGDTASPSRPKDSHESDDETPLEKLTVSLLNTYRGINELYYASKRKPAESPPAAEHDIKRVHAEAVSDGETSGGATASEDDEDYVFAADEVWMGRYAIRDVIGKGSFGQVVHARDQLEGRDVAIKVIKNNPHFAKQARQEIEILQMLNKNDPDDTEHIVRLLRHFTIRGHLCLVFEMLSETLYEHLSSREFVGLPLPLVRHFSSQILQALDFLTLEETNVMHCDLKPENVLLCTAKGTDLKVIDFGSSCKVGDRVYPYIQSRYYRSPEVLFGLHYTQAIDMWSLGCIMVELLTGTALFNGADEQDQVHRIVQVLGMPRDDLLQAASKRDRFFKLDRATGKYMLSTDKYVPGSRKLRDVIGVDSCGPPNPHRKAEPHLAQFYALFLDLLGKVLIYDPDERLVPREALAHAFFQAEMPPPPRINENTDYLDDGETSPDIHKGTIPAPYGDLADSPSSE